MASSSLMETGCLAGWLVGLGRVSLLSLPVIDTALFVREKRTESTQGTISDERGVGIGPDALGKWGGALLPSHLTLRILLPNLLNSGELVFWFPLRHLPRPWIRDPREGETPA